MAVAKDQIEEVLSVISHYVKREQIFPLISDLQHTKAYARNKSFKETIDRLYDSHRINLIDRTKSLLGEFEDDPRYDNYGVRPKD